jgi:hypothetical protein
LPSGSQTIVRKVIGGTDPDSHRFVIMSEMMLPAGGFVFHPTGNAMTAAEVCIALMTRGLSERDAIRLVNEAAAGFKG